jgi:hypothetical protein
MHEVGTGSPVAALSFDGRSWERDVEEIEDRVLARLVRRRLQMERLQGWVVLGVIGALTKAGLVLGAHLNSAVLLFVAATFAASLGVTLGFFTESAFRALFVGEARAVGLSETAARRVFVRAPGVSRVVETMRSIGRDPTDDDLARFVR